MMVSGEMEFITMQSWVQTTAWPFISLEKLRKNLQR
jgi:hypothetical protein